MRKQFLIPFFLLISVARSMGQTTVSESNHLLWRISGNGLSKPSYLFGSMHVTDKRLFYFGDSLYKALEQSEGFAAELDMNSFYTQYINSMLSDDKVKTYIDQLIGKDFIKKYKTQLEGKFKKPISKISLDDINEEEEKQTAEWLKSGEMKTFMDAYLFDIAAKQGKWTGGIEDNEDQMGLKDGLNPEDRIETMFTDKTDKDQGMEWMIQTYQKENLSAIDRSNTIWKGAKDIILLRRNLKMSFRIDSLSHVRTCLFVIGAAHLPGDSGVVSLLTKRGFTVTPVISSKKIAPEDYTYEEKERKWADVYMRDSLFSIEMPFKPEPFKAFENSVMDMQFHFDLGSYSGFFSIEIPATVSSTAMRDSILDRIVKNYRERSIDFSEKDIELGSIPGKEIQLKNEYGTYRMQLFVPGDYVALNAIFAMKEQSLFDKDATHFFSSFKPTLGNNIQKEEVDKWKKFDFNDEAFSIELPGKYSSQEAKFSEESSWTRKDYHVFDIVAQAYYAVTIDQTKEGYYSDKDSIYFQSQKDQIVKLMKADLLSAKDTSFQQYPAYTFLIKSVSAGTDICTQILLVNRGNRRYMLFKTYDPRIAATARDNRFFSSFTFIPLEKNNWQQTTVPDNDFVTWAPTEFKLKKEDGSRATRYTNYNKLSAVTAIVDKETFPPYYWVESDSSLYAQRIKTFMNFNDSLISKVAIKNGNTTGVDLSFWLRQSQNIKKIRLLLSGDTLYTIFCFLPNEVLATGEYQKFFDEFRIKNEHKPVNIFLPKTKKLLDELETGDSSGFNLAKDVLEQVPFKKEDIPFLQQALLHVYRDFDTSYFYGSNTNSKLTNKIRDLDSQYTSTDFIRKNYSTLTGKKELLKPFLLELLSEQRNADSYNLLRELLSKQLPAVDKRYYIQNGFYDSLLLTKTLFPDILSAIEDPGLGEDIADLAVTMLDSNLIDTRMISAYKPVLMRTANRELAKFQKDQEEYSRYISLVRLLSQLNDNESNNLLRKFEKSTNLAIKIQALTGLTGNNQAIDGADLLLLAKSDQYRASLYDKLKAQHKLKIFPVAFSTQRFLGQSKLFEIAGEDDDSPEKIDFIGERVSMFMGQKRKFYLYKVMYAEDDPETYYLGIAGPYSVDGRDLESNHDCTGTYETNTYDAKKIDEYFKQYLKELEEMKKPK